MTEIKRFRFNFFGFFALLMMLSLALPLSAGSNNGLVYHGRILKPDGNPLDSGTVTYTLQVWGSSDKYWDGAAPQVGADRCLLYQETHAKNMTGSLGAFELLVGEGTSPTWGVGAAASDQLISRLFINYPYNSLTSNVVANKIKAISCTNSSASGNIYYPFNNTAAGLEQWVDREFVVAVNTGSTSFTLPAIPIRSTPYALQAAQVAGYSPYNLFKIDGSSSNVFSVLEHDFLWNFAQIKDISGSTCANGEILKVVGGAWKCAVDAGGAGFITAVTATSPLSISGTSTPDVRINDGTLSGQTLRWSGAAWTIAGLGFTDISGTVSISQGGTGTTTAPTNGQILIGGTSGYIPANLTAGSGINISNTSGAISISTMNLGPTAISATGNANQVAIYTAGGVLSGEALLSPLRGGTGLNPTPTSGGLLIGTGDGQYNFANLTAGTGINITNVSGGITISSAGALSNWGLTGNAGTTAGTNFIGTTDSIDVIFKRNSVQSGKLNDSSAATSFGVSALNSSSSGWGNTAFGHSSLYSNTSGWNNTATGSSALYSNSTGGNITSFGYSSLNKNTTGSLHSAVGSLALYNNTTGEANTALGSYALYTNTIGNYNTANGAGSLYETTSGSNNSAIGYRALYKVTTGSDNIAIGYYAGQRQADGATNLTTPSNSIYIGSNTRGFNNSDSNSIVIGDSAIGIGANSVVLGNNSITTTALKGNVGIGTTSPNTSLDLGTKTDAVRLPAGTTAQRPGTPVNGDIRYNSSNNKMEAYENGGWVDMISSSGGTVSGTTGKIAKFTGATAVGDSLLSESGTTMTLAGILAIPSTTSTAGQITMNGNRFLHNAGNGDSVFLGINAGNLTNTGGANVGIGDIALFSITSGGYNVANGHGALSSNTTGFSNVGIGSSALGVNDTGWGNVGIGYQALLFNAAGSYNIALGYAAGLYQADGSTPLAGVSNSIYIGDNSKGLNNSDNNSIVIGSNAVGIGANSVVLGNSSITTTALRGNVGIGTTNPGTKLEVNGVLRINDVGSSNGILRFSSNGNTYIAGTTSAMYFGVNGSDNMVLNNSGSLAIGVSNALSKLDVGGGVAVGSYANSAAAPSNGMIISGNVGIGQTTPLGKLDIQQTTAGSAAILAESGGTNFLKVLNPAGGITSTYNAANSVLYVGSDTVTGRSINASGTVSTGGADFAEWVDWASETKPEMGSIVSYKGGYVVVSSPFTAAFVGNDTKDPKHSILVAFAGQLPVLVRGVVHEGDLIVANGDGTGSAISRDLVSLAMAKNAVGTAWASSNDEGLKRVNVAVGIGLGGNGARDIASVNAKTNKLESENAELKANDKAKDQKIKDLERRLDKIEKALNSK